MSSSRGRDRGPALYPASAKTYDPLKSSTCICMKAVPRRRLRSGSSRLLSLYLIFSFFATPLAVPGMSCIKPRAPTPLFASVLNYAFLADHGMGKGGLGWLGHAPIKQRKTACRNQQIFLVCSLCGLNGKIRTANTVGKFSQQSEVSAPGFCFHGRMKKAARPVSLAKRA